MGGAQRIAGPHRHKERQVLRSQFPLKPQSALPSHTHPYPFTHPTHTILAHSTHAVCPYVILHRGHHPWGLWGGGMHLPSGPLPIGRSSTGTVQGAPSASRGRDHPAVPGTFVLQVREEGRVGCAPRSPWAGEPRVLSSSLASPPPCVALSHPPSWASVPSSGSGEHPPPRLVTSCCWGRAPGPPGPPRSGEAPDPPAPFPCPSWR